MPTALWTIPCDGSSEALVPVAHTSTRCLHALSACLLTHKHAHTHFLLSITVLTAVMGSQQRCRHEVLVAWLVSMEYCGTTVRCSIDRRTGVVLLL